MSIRTSSPFGVADDAIDPQHFIVRLGKTGREPVEVIEDYGISGAKFDTEENAHLDQVIRCRVPAKLWRKVASPLKSALNERLKAKGYRQGRWESGDNRVHRLLGRELCVLLWAIDQLDPDDDRVATAVNAWTGLRPEERWWLYAMAAHSAGKAEHFARGWRKAIRYGLTEGVPLPETHRATLLDGMV